MGREKEGNNIMAGKKSEERVKKLSLQGGVEQVNEIWQRAISKSLGTGS